MTDITSLHCTVLDCLADRPDRLIPPSVYFSCLVVPSLDSPVPPYFYFISTSASSCLFFLLSSSSRFLCLSSFLVSSHPHPLPPPLPRPHLLPPLSLILSSSLPGFQSVESSSVDSMESDRSRSNSLGSEPLTFNLESSLGEVSQLSECCT